MTTDELLELSAKLELEARQMERRIVLGDQEQWYALFCIREAAERLHGAVAWLTLHDQKLSEHGENRKIQ